MKTFKMIATLIHSFFVLLAVLVIIVAVVHLIPNQEAAWIIAVLLGSSTIAVTWVFFLHDKYWYYTHSQLTEERKRYFNAYIEVEKLRKQYIDKFEKTV